jgi:diacylglycerol kinase family enzyme
MADDWKPRRVDLARVNGRHFTFSAGLGLDASVVERVDSHPYRKARFGAWYYTYAALTTFLSRYVVGPPRLEVELPDGRTLTGVTAIVQNADPYTYFQNRPVRVADGGALDDGTLTGAVLRRSTPTVMPTVIWRVFSKRARLSRHRAVDGFTGVEELVVRSIDGSGLPLQCDGDHIGDVTEARFGIAPRALAVVS